MSVYVCVKCECMCASSVSVYVCVKCECVCVRKCYRVYFRSGLSSLNSART